MVCVVRRDGWLCEELATKDGAGGYRETLHRNARDKPLVAMAARDFAAEPAPEARRHTSLGQRPREQAPLERRGLKARFISLVAPNSRTKEPRAATRLESTIHRCNLCLNPFPIFWSISSSVRKNGHLFSRRRFDRISTLTLQRLSVLSIANASALEACRIMFTWQSASRGPSPSLRWSRN